MILNPFEGGAFADVFDLGNGRILKAFRLIAPSVAPGLDTTLIPRMCFQAEHLAYTALQEQGELSRYIPTFYGPADPQSYPLQSQELYAAECGLVLERIPGQALKLGSLSAEILNQAEEVIEAMREVVYLDDPWDGSCFIPGTRAAFTLIDIATPSTRLGALDDVLRQNAGDGAWGVTL